MFYKNGHLYTIGVFSKTKISFISEILDSSSWKRFKLSGAENSALNVSFFSKTRQNVCSAGTSALVHSVPVSSGIWNASIPEGALVLAQQLPELLNAAFAPKTLSKYGRAWAKFKTWCARLHINAICPATNMTVALYYVHILDTMRTRGALSDANNAINWAHNLADCKSPTKSKFVKKVLEGAKRKCRKLSNQKDPISAEDIIELFALTDMNSAQALRFLLTVVLAFAGFMRISEFFSMQIKHIELTEEYVKILLPKSKTDQSREGHFLYVQGPERPHVQ